jgi:hypothetical protein
MAEALTIQGIWAAMPDEVATRILREVRAEEADLYRQALGTAAGALRMRPQALQQQPAPRQAAAIRRALTQVGREELGAHLLVTWLTKCRTPMLARFLDDLGIAHEEGTIKDEVGPEPDAAQLRAAIERLYAAFPAEDVRIYLQAFAVTTAVEWEHLPTLIDAQPLSH